MNSVLDGRIGGVWVCGCPKRADRNALRLFEAPSGRQAVSYWGLAGESMRSALVNDWTSDFTLSKEIGNVLSIACVYLSD